MSLNFKITRKPTRNSTTSLSNLHDSDTKIPSFNRLSVPSDKLYTEPNFDSISNTNDADNLKVSSITSLDEDYHSTPDVSMGSEALSLTTKSKVVDSRSQTCSDFAKQQNIKGSTVSKINMGSTMISFNNPITRTCTASQVSIAKSQMRNDDLPGDISPFTTRLTPQSRKNLGTINKEFSQLIGECRDLSKRVRKISRRASQNEKTLINSIQSLPEDASESKLQIDASWKKDTDLTQKRKTVKEGVIQFRKKFQEEQKMQETLKEICGTANSWVENEEDEKLSRIERLLIKEPQTFRIKKNKTRYAQITDRLKTYDLASDMEKLDFNNPLADDTESKPNKVFALGRLSITNLDALEEKQPTSQRSDKSSKKLLKPEQANKHLRVMSSRNSARPRTLQNFEITEENSCSSGEESTLEPNHKNISTPVNAVSSVRVKRFSAKYRLKESERVCSKGSIEEEKLKAWDNIPDFNLFKKSGRLSKRRYSIAYLE